ncbi:hypothetical protein HPP92_027981 [Vanilla planifolia]|uniref:CASP-like protein n=1 Tax=Vanilla planifolia TaxID=51239 RepID=A0A835P772_VANPL|nr:hypothetical protein HPP92_027981 [Vanilla planifolia]
MENGGSGLTQKKFVMLQLLLRPLSALFSVVAALVMVLSKETRDLTGHQMTASYSISPELRFFVVGNFLSCGYALLSLPLVSIPANSFILYVLDLMNMALIVSAVSVGTAIGSLARMDGTLLLLRVLLPSGGDRHGFLFVGLFLPSQLLPLSDLCHQEVEEGTATAEQQQNLTEIPSFSCKAFAQPEFYQLCMEKIGL